jgi:hypothetical protein
VVEKNKNMDLLRSEIRPIFVLDGKAILAFLEQIFDIDEKRILLFLTIRGRMFPLLNSLGLWEGPVELLL